MNPQVARTGGLLVLVGAVVLAVFDSLITGGPADGFAWASNGLQIYQNVATAMAYLAVVMGVLIFAKPGAKNIWASIAIVGAVLSLPFAFSAFFVGLVLILVGGVLTFRYKAEAGTKSAPPTSAPPPT